MKDLQEACTSPVVEEKHVKESKPEAPPNSGRRSFIGKFGMGSAAVVALAAVPFEPLIEGKHAEAEASDIQYNEDTRSAASYQYRVTTAEAEDIDPGELPDNGDFARYPDFSGVHTKAFNHPHLGIPDHAAYETLVTALTSGNFVDFEHIQVGHPGQLWSTATLNDPQGALAFDLEGRDSHAANFIGPAPTDRSDQTAAEEVEHYWAALLRDVQFTQYGTNSLVGQAVADMNARAYLQSAQNNEYPYPLTPKKLFRGVFNPTDPNDPNLLGPYISQFLLQPTMLGAAAISQMYQRFKSVSEGGADYMTDPLEFQNVENGGQPTGVLHLDDFRYIRMGRDLAAYTHVDQIAQEYIIALLVLDTIGAPVNRGNPYTYPNGVSQSEHGFFTFVSTFEHCDAITTLVEVASRALKAAWFHKWIVNLRLRPEEYAGLVQARLTAQNPLPLASVDLSPDLFRSSVLNLIHQQYGSYLLPQAFPEGCPTHPCYPTGHGTVAGACITVLKFFYDGGQLIRPLLQAIGRDVYVPSSDGLSLIPYTDITNDADRLTVNGELAKLGYNVTFAHGIHAGIHFRSSSLSSLLLGEAVALSVLQDRAQSYNEPFTIQITKFDGTTVNITNSV